MKNIYDLNVGDQTKILGVENTVTYLFEMGFIPGETIEIIAKSPFNGPISIRVKGTTIALRQEEAIQIQC